MHRLADYFRSTFGLDLRSLAAMRIGLAGVVLTDLAIRASDFRAMYSSAGFAPVEFVRELQQLPVWSLHLLSGNDAWQALLFGLAALLALAMLVGYRTRLAVIGSWILLTSLQMRLPLVLNAGDTMLRVALFWSMFLPVGEAWSLDARRRRSPAGLSQGHPHVSFATFALIVQLAIVYWFAGWAKWNDAWLRGDALGNVCKFGLYGLPLGTALSGYPALTQLFSRVTVWLEILGPLLLFIPWQAARLRLIAFTAFVLLHLGIAVTMTVGLFSYAAIAVWLAVLPREFWDRFAAFRWAEPPPPVSMTPIFSSRRVGRNFITALSVLSLAIVVYWNIASEVSRHALNSFDRSVRMAGHLTGLRQGWGVFARPPRRDGWFVYQARLQNGELVDLWSGGAEVLQQKPALTSRQFSNHRWRKLHLRLRADSCAPYRQALADYMVRRWNAEHGPSEQVVRLDFYYYSQEFDLAGTPGDHARMTLAQVVAGDEGGNFAEALRDGSEF
ncbi:MAG: HTTM domain-containing protein [Planctomycetaceae bacterium]|nr:HTTM domain-containing protein [Planctomycetaceae bacterium]